MVIICSINNYLAILNSINIIGVIYAERKIFTLLVDGEWNCKCFSWCLYFF